MIACSSNWHRSSIGAECWANSPIRACGISANNCANSGKYCIAVRIRAKSRGRAERKANRARIRSKSPI